MTCGNCRTNQEDTVTLCPFHSLAPMMLQTFLDSLTRDIKDTARAIKAAKEDA